MAHQLHLAERVVHAARGVGVHLGAHDLARDNVLDLVGVRVHVVLAGFLRRALLLGLRVRLHLRGQHTGALRCAVAGHRDVATCLDLAQRALQLVHRGLECGVEVLLLRLSASQVARAGGGDLDALRLCLAARVLLVLQLHMERLERRIKLFNLGQLAVYSFLEMLWDLDVSTGDGDLGFRAQRLLDRVAVCRRHLRPPLR